jgi:hypothetical protein
MFAIELNASIFCARVTRGTWSIASTVARRSPSRCTSSWFAAGQMKLTSVADGCSRSASWCPSAVSSSGGRTFSTISASRQRATVSLTTRAPAAM